jgi:hypothetical protein
MPFTMILIGTMSHSVFFFLGEMLTEMSLLF